MSYHTATAARAEAEMNRHADHALAILAALQWLETVTQKASAAGVEFRSVLNENDTFTESAAVWIDDWKGRIEQYARGDA